MGKALSALFSSEKAAAINIVIDLESAEPKTDAEKALHAEVAEYLKESHTILQQITDFRGCETAIRAAITTPGPETEGAAWNSIVPSVELLKTFFDFSTGLEEVVPKLLHALFSADDKSESLEGQQALVKQLADILDFVLRFDSAKMINPAIQNDFSYYRRSLSKHKNKANVTIKDDLANRMSLFLAYPTPMLKVITETTSNEVNDTKSIAVQDVVLGFTLMANVCLEMVQKGLFKDKKDTNLFALRAMTASIVLVDHIDQQGAFHRKGGIHIKNAIGALKDITDGSTETMLNALRFSTVHLNDVETPQIIKTMLA